MRAPILFLLFILSYVAASSQICEGIIIQSYFDFTVSVQKNSSNNKELSILFVSKNQETVFTDTVVTNSKDCTGFSFPAQQPFKDYFVFSKRERKNGKTYILYKNGDWKIIPGGSFWAAPQHQLLFVLAERDYTNLLVYDLKNRKTLLEKFNCDEFTGWYYRAGNYYGRVEMECGLEPEHEREISEWLRPVEVEQFETKPYTLYETHLGEKELERAKPLVRYASCR